jgi:hypothetical protein
MTANTQPIFSVTGDVSNNAGTGMNQAINAAANDFDGTSASNQLVFTSGANGSFIHRLRFKAGGTNAASVARIFINNGSANTTAANNSLFGDLPLPSTTASATSVTGPELDYVMNMALPAGFRIFVGLATGVSAGWVVTPVAGQY